MFTFIMTKTNTMIFATLNDLKTAVGLTPGDQAILLGCFDPGDGGGGEFYWDSHSIDAPDNQFVIAVTGLSTGRWKRVTEKPIRARWVSPWLEEAETDYINKGCLDGQPF